MKPTYVYLIKPVGMEGPVKIGCSFAPSDRLLTLGKWSPFPLEVIATFPGTLQLEQNIHECLWRSHSHHEWFLPTAEVLGFVAAIVAGRPVEQAIDLSQKHRISRPGSPKFWPPHLRLKMSYNHRIRGAVKRESARRGESVWAPKVVDDVLQTLYVREPTPADLDCLEAFLRDPASQCQTQTERFPPRSGADA